MGNVDVNDSVPTKGLVAQYLLNEYGGNVVHDSSSKGHGGVLKRARWGPDRHPKRDESIGISGGGC